jgi:hypothetical protein
MRAIVILALSQVMHSFFGKEKWHLAMEQVLLPA